MNRILSPTNGTLTFLLLTFLPQRFPHRAAVFGNIATIAEYSIEVIVGGAQQDFTVQLTTRYASPGDGV